MRFTDYPIRGIDLSEHNGKVDFSKLKSAGASFYILRAGYGRTTDKRFVENWQKADQFRMAYWYLDYYSNWYNPKSQAYGISDYEWGAEQARRACALGKPIIWIDVESGGSSYSPNIYTCWNRVEKMLDGWFFELDRLTSIKNGIYNSVGMLSKFSDRFRDRNLWVAWYNESVNTYDVLYAVKKNGWRGKCLIWQYSSDGDINGDGAPDGRIFGTESNALDLNIWMQSPQEWKDFSREMILHEPEFELDKIGKHAVTLVRLNVRKEPKLSASIWDTAPVGIRFEVLEVKGDWVRVGWNQWVISRLGGVEYLRFD